MNVLAQEIQTSGTATEVESAWTKVQTELTAAIASMQTDGSISTDGLEGALADFQAALDSAGEEITPEMRSAWQSLRLKVEQMMD